MSVSRQYDRVSPCLFLLLVLAFLAGCSSTGRQDAAQACEAANGQFVAEFGECLGVSPEACDSMAGAFQACASPCRHEPGVMMCITRCDAVCTLAE